MFRFAVPIRFLTGLSSWGMPWYCSPKHTTCIVHTSISMSTNLWGCRSPDQWVCKWHTRHCAGLGPGLGAVCALQAPLFRPGEVRPTRRPHLPRPLWFFACPCKPPHRSAGLLWHVRYTVHTVPHTVDTVRTVRLSAPIFFSKQGKNQCRTQEKSKFQFILNRD